MGPRNGSKGRWGAIFQAAAATAATGFWVAADDFGAASSKSSGCFGEDDPIVCGSLVKVGDCDLASNVGISVREMCPDLCNACICPSNRCSAGWADPTIDPKDGQAISEPVAGTYVCEIADDLCVPQVGNIVYCRLYGQSLCIWRGSATAVIDDSHDFEWKIWHIVVIVMISTIAVFIFCGTGCLLGAKTNERRWESAVAPTMLATQSNSQLQAEYLPQIQPTRQHECAQTSFSETGCRSQRKSHHIVQSARSETPQIPLHKVQQTAPTRGAPQTTAYRGGNEEWSQTGYPTQQF
jgi:hypothetical protein